MVLFQDLTIMCSGGRPTWWPRSLDRHVRTCVPAAQSTSPTLPGGGSGSEGPSTDCCTTPAQAPAGPAGSKGDEQDHVKLFELVLRVFEWGGGQTQPGRPAPSLHGWAVGEITNFFLYVTNTPVNWKPCRNLRVAVKQICRSRHIELINMITYQIFMSFMSSCMNEEFVINK